jgi:hypothetical protein
MPLKTRVMVTKGPPKGRSVLDTMVYRAQVYDPDDPKREFIWQCTHEHESALDAYACAKEWAERHEQP